MQYPTGTNFAVNQSKLSAAPFRGKFLFKDGIYSILNIKRNQNTIEYTFNFNGVSGEAVNQQVFDDAKNNAVSGADKPYSYNVYDASKSIFDYSQTNYGDVYGGY